LLRQVPLSAACWRNWEQALELPEEDLHPRPSPAQASSKHDNSSRKHTRAFPPWALTQVRRTSCHPGPRTNRRKVAAFPFPPKSNARRGTSRNSRAEFWKTKRGAQVGREAPAGSQRTVLFVDAAHFRHAFIPGYTLVHWGGCTHSAPRFWQERLQRCWGSGQRSATKT